MVNLISKSIFIQEYREVDLKEVSRMLNSIGIYKLNIFCIDKISGINKTVVQEPSLVTLFELGAEDFIQVLNNPGDDFMSYNKDSLYVLRDSDFIDVKNIFSKINSYEVNIGRGAGQKCSILSPLEFRLSSYLMAIFKFKYFEISRLNTFNFLDKSRYLTYNNKYANKKRNKKQ
jgi:hypothetical protein